ncbi:hypothetical protein [Levilactobacillus wangkuiensis]|nr:hypothetical protein [Levilactobacillus wangkuiensis]
MSEISVEKRWTCQKDEKYIVRACEELMRRTGGVRKQYEFICNVEAFVENASEAFNSNHVSMMDAFLDDQRINASSYN